MKDSFYNLIATCIFIAVVVMTVLFAYLYNHFR